MDRIKRAAPSEHDPRVAARDTPETTLTEAQVAELINNTDFSYNVVFGYGWSDLIAKLFRKKPTL